MDISFSDWDENDLIRSLLGINGRGHGGAGGMSGAGGAGAAIGGAAAVGGAIAGALGGTGSQTQPKPGTGSQTETKEETIPSLPEKPEDKDPVPGIQDKTDENVETSINGIGGATQSIFDFMEQQQQKLWEREDLIRQETQEREDTAYQRAVKDMQAAGINPNLMNVSPASSGGGITSATGMNYTPYELEVQKQVALLEQELDQAFEGDQNAKDRFKDILADVIQSIIMYKTFKK